MSSGTDVQIQSSDQYENGCPRSPCWEPESGNPNPALNQASIKETQSATGAVAYRDTVAISLSTPSTGPDPAARAARRAVQRRRRAGKIELPLQRPALQQSVNKPRVEDIARARRVDHRHAIRGPQMSTGSPSHASTPSCAQRRRGQPAAVPLLQRPQGPLQIALARQARRKIAAHDQVVDAAASGHRRRRRSRRDRRSPERRPRRAHRAACVAAAVSKPSTSSARAFTIHSRLEIVRLQQQPLVAPAQHRPLAAAVHKDQRLRARRICHVDQARIHARRAQIRGDAAAPHRRRPACPRSASSVPTSGTAITALAVWPPGISDTGAYSTFEPRTGNSCQRNQSVRGVESNSHEIDHGSLRHDHNCTCSF